MAAPDGRAALGVPAHRVTLAQNSPARSFAACRCGGVRGNARLASTHLAVERSNCPCKQALHLMSHCSKGCNVLHGSKINFIFSCLSQFYQEKNATTSKEFCKLASAEQIYCITKLPSCISHLVLVITV